MNEYAYIKEDFIYHHGRKGMKWGVRRYQNPDGTLTEAGRKRINSSMSSNKIHKRLKKAIRNARGSQNGQANRFMVNTPIGKNSRKLIEQDKENRKRYEASKAYKDWQKKFDNLDKKYNDLYSKNGFIDLDEYDKEYKKIWDQKPKRNYNSLAFAKIYSSTGMHYADNYLEKGGKDLSIAYLKDLGYNQKQSEALVNRMLKKNKTLGDI